jgi:hypothetical protein
MFLYFVVLSLGMGDYNFSLPYVALGGLPQVAASCNKTHNTNEYKENKENKDTQTHNN